MKKIKFALIVLTLVMINKTAKAQIIYTHLNPAVKLSSATSVYNLDLNNDGVADFKITNKYIV